MADKKKGLRQMSEMQKALRMSKQFKKQEGKVGQGSSKALARLQKVKKASGALPKLSSRAGIAREILSLIRRGSSRAAGGPGLSRKELEKLAGKAKLKPTAAVRKSDKPLTRKREARRRMRRK